MSNQYFENNDSLESNIHEITYYYYGKTLKFYTDNGVFSKSGIDFGSSVLLKSITIEATDKSILDVGCGYGTIGLSLAATHNAHVDMVDINLRALSLANKGALINGISNVRIFESNVYEHVDKLYDVIVTNPPIRAGKQIVHAILLDGYEYLKKGGSLWCVIQKKQGAPSAITALSTNMQWLKLSTKKNNTILSKLLSRKKFPEKGVF